MSKRIDLNVEVNPRILEAMKGFIPMVGSSDDIRIVEEYSKLLNLYTLMNDAHKRAEKRGTTYKPSDAKNKDIDELEKRLLWLMNKRNEKTDNKNKSG